MILSKKNFGISLPLLTNIVFAFFPVSFIFGNLFININFLLFCVLGIFLLRSKILAMKFNLSTKIIFLLFIAFLFSSCLNFVQSLYFEGYEYENLKRLIKSVLFFRFFLILLIIYLLCELDILKFKYFFLATCCIPALISLDIIYQYFSGFNIIGLKSYVTHNTGFFGDELIAGGFIKNFSFFSIFFVAFLLRNKNNFSIGLTTIVICILGIGILTSGNRMSLIMFLFGLVLTFLLSKKLRLIVPLSFVCMFIVIKFVLSLSPASYDTMKSRYSSLYDNYVIGEVFPRLEILIPPKIMSKFPKVENYFNESYKIRLEAKTWHTPAVHDREIIVIKIIYGKAPTKYIFATAIDTWSRNKIFGNGMKSFREDCKDKSKYIHTETTNFAKDKRRCSSHPHNYYFEILTDTGIVGLVIFLIVLLFVVIFIFKNLDVLRGNNIENFFILAAVITLIVLLFPFQTTGSIFGTSNATYIILVSSIVACHKKILDTKNFQ